MTGTRTLESVRLEDDKKGRARLSVGAFGNNVYDARAQRPALGG